MKKFLILAALIAAPLTAQADPAYSIQVSTAGLDLSNATDAYAMIQRIEAAVQPLCAAPDHNRRQSTRGCVAAYTRDTVARMHRAELDVALRIGAAPAIQTASR